VKVIITKNSPQQLEEILCILKEIEILMTKYLPEKVVVK
jgi:hypothetical protein